MSKSSGGRWKEVVEWFVQDNGSCRVMHSQTRSGGGGWGQKPKLSCHGLVLDLLCQTEVVKGGGRWWGGSYDAIVVVGLRVCKYEAVERVGGQKPETERDGSVLGCIWALRGEGGWYVVISPFLE